jgi:hypothetical protein
VREDLPGEVNVLEGCGLSREIGSGGIGEDRRSGGKRTDGSAADNGHLALFLLRRHGGQGVTGYVVVLCRAEDPMGLVVL